MQASKAAYSHKRQKKTKVESEPVRHDILKNEQKLNVLGGRLSSSFVIIINRISSAASRLAESNKVFDFDFFLFFSIIF